MYDNIIIAMYTHTHTYNYIYTVYHITFPLEDLNPQVPVHYHFYLLNYYTNHIVSSIGFGLCIQLVLKLSILTITTLVRTYTYIKCVCFCMYILMYVIHKYNTYKSILTHTYIHMYIEIGIHVKYPYIIAL